MDKKCKTPETSIQNTESTRTLIITTQTLSVDSKQVGVHGQKQTTIPILVCRQLKHIKDYNKNLIWDEQMYFVYTRRGFDDIGVRYINSMRIINIINLGGRVYTCDSTDRYLVR